MKTRIISAIALLLFMASPFLALADTITGTWDSGNYRYNISSAFLLTNTYTFTCSFAPVAVQINDGSGYSSTTVVGGSSYSFIPAEYANTWIWIFQNSDGSGLRDCTGGGTLTFTGTPTTSTPATTQATSTYDTTCTTVTNGATSTEICDDPLKTQTRGLESFAEIAILVIFGTWFIMWHGKKEIS